MILLLVNLFSIRSFNALYTDSSAHHFLSGNFIRYQNEIHHNAFALEVAGDVSLYSGEGFLLPVISQQFDNYFRWKRLLLSDGGITAEVLLDRLNLKYMGDFFTLSVGRQAITFGKGHFISIWDLFSPFQPYSIDFSFKRGTDALRVNAYREYLNADIIIAFTGTKAVSAGTTFNFWDFSANVVVRKDTFYAGYSVEGNLSSGILWSEGIFQRKGYLLSAGYDFYTSGGMLSIGLSYGNSTPRWYPLPRKQFFLLLESNYIHGFSIIAGYWYGKSLHDIHLVYASIRRESGDNADISLYIAGSRFQSGFYMTGIYCRWFF